MKKIDVGWVRRVIAMIFPARATLAPAAVTQHPLCRVMGRWLLGYGGPDRSPKDMGPGLSASNPTYGGSMISVGGI